MSLYLIYIRKFTLKSVQLYSASEYDWVYNNCASSGVDYLTDPAGQEESFTQDHFEISLLFQMTAHRPWGYGEKSNAIGPINPDLGENVYE